MLKFLWLYNHCTIYKYIGIPFSVYDHIQAYFYHGCHFPA